MSSFPILIQRLWLVFEKRCQVLLILNSNINQLGGGNFEKNIFKHPSKDVVRACIVAQYFPANKSNPAMEKAKQEFRKVYNCDLRGVKSGQEEKL